MSHNFVSCVGSQREYRLFAECGQSIKTSLLYVAQSHNRNDPFRPSPGCYWSYGAEWAMPLQRGWMNFLKFDGRIGRSIPLTNWLVNTQPPQQSPILIARQNLNLNGRSGVMRGDSRMIDRFFVGGPYCIRGFQERGIGSYNRYGKTASCHSDIADICVLQVLTSIMLWEHHCYFLCLSPRIYPF